MIFILYERVYAISSISDQLKQPWPYLYLAPFSG